MIPESVKVSDARVQSFGLKFSFVTEPDKLIIQATCSKDNEQYVGQIQTNPYSNFQLVKQMLEEGDFKIIMKTQQLLKIRIGAMILEMTSKSKSQIKELKQALEKLLEKQSQLQNNIQSHKKKIDAHELQISDLRKTVEEMKQNPKVSIIQKQKIYQELNRKINQLSKNQKYFEQLINDIKRLKQNDDTNKVNIQSVKIYVQNLKNQLKEVDNFTKKSINDLEVTNSSHSVIINEIQKSVEEEMKKNKAILDGHQNRLKELQKIKVKVSQFNSILQNRLVELKQSIFKHQIVNQLIEEKIQINEKQREERERQRERQQKLILAKKQEQKKMKQYNQQLSKSFIWAQQLKHSNILIDGSCVQISPRIYYGYIFCLLKAGFTQQLKEKQSWAIKIKNFLGYEIMIGVCVKSLMQKNCFNDKKLNWNEKNHGLHVINSCKLGFSYSDIKENFVKINFCYKNNDLISIQYDPIEKKLRFRNENDQNNYECNINPPPQGDSYHPCIGFKHESGLFFGLVPKLKVEVEVLYPIKPIQK